MFLNSSSLDCLHWIIDQWSTFPQPSHSHNNSAKTWIIYDLHLDTIHSISVQFHRNPTCRVPRKFCRISWKKILTIFRKEYFQCCLSSQSTRGLLRSIEFKFVIIEIASFRNVMGWGGGGGGGDNIYLVMVWSSLVWSGHAHSHFIELCDSLLHCIIAHRRTGRNFIFYWWLCEMISYLAVSPPVTARLVTRRRSRRLMVFWSLSGYLGSDWAGHQLTGPLKGNRL